MLKGTTPGITAAQAAALYLPLTGGTLTGGLTAPLLLVNAAGAVGAPAYGFGTTGIYFSAVNGNLLFTVAGVLKATLNTAGTLILANGLTIGSSNVVGWADSYIYGAVANGQIRIGSLGSSSTSLTFGGEANTNPALFQSTAALHAKLGDNSAFAVFKAKLTTDTNATTGLVAGVLSATTNASIVVYDGAGQAYRIPCII